MKIIAAIVLIYLIVKNLGTLWRNKVKILAAFFVIALIAKNLQALIAFTIVFGFWAAIFAFFGSALDDYNQTAREEEFYRWYWYHRR